MPLAAGTRLGPYEVGDVLGAGGMGEVYRARDLSLGRDVAIKVLPEEFAQDAERLARFEREARTLASLNHPNIATIHGLERSELIAGSVRALVMELVEGPTLADRIAEGALPLDEALAIARQIAEALEAAHEQGVVHRDLKPANIKLRDDGTAKVLDFGLAKTVEPAPMSAGRSLSPTITTPAMTQAGMILGTAAYMSPEQAKGRGADKRSDIWAFGCLLYEMLTGGRAFGGEDVSDTLATVLRGEPDWSALPADLPPPIVTLIKRSLEKDRRRRIGDMAAARFVLADPQIAPAGRPSTAATRRLSMTTGAATLVGAALAAFAGWWVGTRTVPEESKPITRFIVPLEADQQFAVSGRNAVLLSPDGRHLVYNANQRLYLRTLDRLDAVAIRGTETPLTSFGLARDPFFSSDGKWIGFWHDGQIKKIAIAGGSLVAITQAPTATAFAWEDDGTILYAADGAIWRIPEAGGSPEALVEGLKGRVQSLELLPGRRALLYVLFPQSTITDAHVVVHSLDGARQAVISRSGLQAHYVATGHIVYFDGGSLLAVPFDLDSLSARGAPVPVVEGVAFSPAPSRAINAAHVAISRTGTLAYISGDFRSSGRRTMVWVDRSGREEPLGAEEHSYVYPRLSPDGRRVALTAGEEDRDIWVWDATLKTLQRFTTEPGQERYAAWTPDGKRIAFGSNRGDQAGIFWKPSDGAGPADRLVGFPISKFTNFLPTTIAPDGTRLVATATGPGTTGSADLWVVNLTPQPSTAPLLATNASERNAEISPDGRWMAYESVSGQEAEIWLRPFPNVDAGSWQVTTSGGSQPLWSRDGRELFYRNLSGAVMSVPVTAESAPVIGNPTKVLDGTYVHAVPTFAGRLYDVSPDGKRFLMLKDSSSRERSTAPRAVIVVENWFEELKRLAPPR